MKNIYSFMILIPALILAAFLPEWVYSQNPPDKGAAAPQTAFDHLGSKIKTLDDRISQARKEESEETAVQLGVCLADLQKRTSLLLELKTVYERRLSELTQEKEYTAIIDDLVSKKETYFEKKPPYSLSQLDHHMVSLAKKIQLRDEAKLEKELAQRLLDEAKIDLEKTDAALKAAQEKAEKIKNDPQNPQAQWELSISELEKEVSDAVVDLRKKALENKETAFNIAAQIADLFHHHSEEMKKHLSFNQEDLDFQLQTIRSQKEKLRDQLEKMKKKDADAEQKFIKKQKTLFQAVKGTSLDESESLKSASRSYKTIIKQLELSLAALTQQESVWRQRYELLLHETDYEKLLSLQKEARMQIDQILKTIGSVQKEQMAVQLQLLELEKTISAQSAGYTEAAVMKDQLTALKELSTHLFQYSGILQATKDLYGKLSEETGSRMVKVHLFHKSMAYLQNALKFQIYQNSLIDYFIAMITFLIGILVIKFVKSVVFKQLMKWASQLPGMFDDYLVNTTEKMAMPILYFGAFYLSVRGLTLHPIISKLIYVSGISILTFFIIRFCLNIIDYFIKDYWLKKEENIRHESSVRAIMPMIKVAAWAIGVFFMLDNLGFKISAVIAGLGIGGIAIALASQNILGDLFNYFVILFDRPFEIGDYITINEHKGTIEHIGIKTTRLRSLSGEQLIFANTDLTGSRVSNYKRMEKRRVLFHIGVTYDTPENRLREIPSIISGIIKKIKDTEFERAHFSVYGDFSLIFEIVYYVIGREYIKYMEIQQEINLALKVEFEKRNIDFAYPTQTLILQQGLCNVTPNSEMSFPV